MLDSRDFVKMATPAVPGIGDPVTQLRNMLEAERDSIIVPASVYDPLSAKMAEQMNFPLMQLAGSVEQIYHQNRIKNDEIRCKIMLCKGN